MGQLPEAPSYWRPGDNPAARKFASIGSVSLEFGSSLPDVVVAYETWGSLNAARDNAVLVLHALTGDAHVTGEAGPGQPTPGWWPQIAGTGKVLDPAEFFIVAANVLGGCQGTTGPSSLDPDGKPWGSRWPRISVRDQVKAEVGLADALGIDRFALVVGGSMGGLRALEWVVDYPDRVGSAVILACGAVASADQIATQTTQLQAIVADPAWQGGDYYDSPLGPPTTGLGIARRIAHQTYRTEAEFADRFGNDHQPGENPHGPAVAGIGRISDRYAIQSYLDHHADKLSYRFDAGTYVTLTDAMTTFDVGRGRGGVAAALGQVRVPTVVGGITSDRLYPLYLQEELAELIPTTNGLNAIESPYGHDGFLLEDVAVAQLVTDAIDLARS